MPRHAPGVACAALLIVDEAKISQLFCWGSQAILLYTKPLLGVNRLMNHQINQLFSLLIDGSAVTPAAGAANGNAPCQWLSVRSVIPAFVLQAA